jgi:predicted glycosyltransferase
LQQLKNKKILIAPLDWGLGHATRCIPIINHLLTYTNNITIAANGIQLQLLQNQFSSLNFISIPNYNITYANNTISTNIKLLFQLIKIKKAISQENKWLQQIQATQRYDIILSDNRYGLYHKSATCIFITHQLKPKTFFGKFGQQFLQKQLYKYINQFTQCWVMDNKGSNSLAGDLSNPTLMPTIPTSYIGIHTRLKQIPCDNKKYSIAIILSGPEPQRTLIENIIIKQLTIIQEAVILIRGTNNILPIQALPKNVEIVSVANAQQIETLIAQSQFVLCRSGYTSLMDYLSIGVKCIVVPTPGQTEQEYLAKYTSNQNLTMRILQNNLQLHMILKKAKNYSFTLLKTEKNILAQKISTLFNL